MCCYPGHTCKHELGAYSSNECVPDTPAPHVPTSMVLPLSEKLAFSISGFRCTHILGQGTDSNGVITAAAAALVSFCLPLLRLLLLMAAAVELQVNIVQGKSGSLHSSSAPHCAVVLHWRMRLRLSSTAALTSGRWQTSTHTPAAMHLQAAAAASPAARSGNSLNSGRWSVQCAVVVNLPNKPF